jgi:hypothetical protein
MNLDPPGSTAGIHAWSAVGHRETCTPIAAMTAGGIGRSRPCAASPTASWRALDAASRARNRAIASFRARIERTFAILKRWYGYRRVRYRRLVRNALQLQLLACAFNLRRALALTG